MVVPRVSLKKDKAWHSLKKSWKKYKIAKNKGDLQTQTKTAQTILILQGRLGLRLSKFKELGHT